MIRNFTWPITLVSALVTSTTAIEELEFKNRRPESIASSVQQTTPEAIQVQAVTDHAAKESTQAQLDARLAMGRQLLDG